MNERSTPKDFVLGNMTDDLVVLTIEMCGKKQDKCTRFPKWLYETYVDEIMKSALTIQRNIIDANEYPRGSGRREAGQNLAIAECVHLNHLIRIAYANRWISEKQRDRWQRLTTAIKFKAINWRKTEIK